MTLAKHLSTNLKVIVTKHFLARLTCQTYWMEFLQRLRLQILALNTAATSSAETVIQRVVVVLAVGIVVEDVEVAGGEWR